MKPGASLQAKVAVVTGGSGGLGSATVRQLAAAGVRVAVVDLDVESGERLASEVDGLFVKADVAQLDQNAGMFDAIEEYFGGIDLVYLNAGIASGCTLGEDFSLERYRAAMAVNIDGVVFGVHCALPALSRRGGGAIVATASLAGLTGVPMDPIYAANKHAVVGLVRSLGPVLLADRVRINAICPGFAESAIIEPIRESIIASGVPIIPAGDVAAAVLELMAGEMTGECWYVQAGRDSEAFRFRNVPGHRSEPA